MILNLRKKLTLCISVALTICAILIFIPSIIARDIESISILMPAPFADSTVKLVEEFNAKYANSIHLDVIRGPLETEAISDLAISSLLLGDTPFDAILMDITWLPKYARAGWLEALDKGFDQSEIQDLTNGAQLGNIYDGSLYRWPLVADMGLLFWRTDLMDKPPSTPSELVAISQELQRKNKATWGYVWQGRQYEGLSCVYLEMIDGFGGQWFNPNGEEFGLDQQPGINAAQWLTNLINNGISPRAVTNYAESEALQSFKSGDSALMRNWPYAWAELQKEDSQVRGHVGISTMVSIPGVSPASTMGSWGLSLLKGSKHKEAAIKAFKYLTSNEAQTKLFTEYGYTPTRKSVYQNEELLKEYPYIAKLYEALTVAKMRPETPIYAQLSDVLQRSLSASLTDEINAETSMINAQIASEQIMSAAGGGSQ